MEEQGEEGHMTGAEEAGRRARQKRAEPEARVWCARHREGVWMEASSCKRQRAASTPQWQEDSPEKTTGWQRRREKNSFQLSVISFPTNHRRWWIGVIKANIQRFQFTWKEGRNTLLHRRSGRLLHKGYNPTLLFQYTWVCRNPGWVYIHRLTLRLLVNFIIFLTCSSPN